VALQGLYRRSSGVYVARLIVPERHRAGVGRSEFVASTGSREVGVARIVAGELVAAWRRQLHNLDREASGMDPLQLTIGAPALSAPGHLPIAEAAAHAGLEVVELLRVAADGRLGLFLRLSDLDGHVISDDDCDVDRDASGHSLIVPSADQMPHHAVRAPYFGVVRLRLGGLTVLRHAGRYVAHHRTRQSSSC
jgi:hypothetical protein